MVCSGDEDRISSERLDKLLFDIFCDGYKQGAVAVAEGEIIVEKRAAGKYYLRGDNHVSTNPAKIG